MTVTVTQINEEMKPSRKVSQKFYEMGGHVTEVTDKSIVIEFPSQYHANEFMSFASRVDGVAFRR